MCWYWGLRFAILLFESPDWRVSNLTARSVPEVRYDTTSDSYDQTVGDKLQAAGILGKPQQESELKKPVSIIKEKEKVTERADKRVVIL